jgi:hypothetical protein
VHLNCGHALIAGLFSLKFAEELTQSRADLMQLRLRNTHQAPQYPGNLIVLVPCVVQGKYCALAHGKPLGAAFEIYSVNRSF